MRLAIPGMTRKNFAIKDRNIVESGINGNLVAADKLDL